MSGGESAGRPRLRDRKKAKTRATIRACALQLFQTHGYEATTVELIAEAAEVSPSTFFRYFRTKEDVVLADDYDAPILAAFEAQPASTGAAQALRSALWAVLGDMDPAGYTELRQRMVLTFAVPALRAAFVDGFMQATGALAAAAARRSGRDPDDAAARSFAGAAVGVLIAAYLYWAGHPESDLLGGMDAMLAELQDGFAR